MNVTITLFVEPNSLTTFIQVLKILDTLPIDNEYVFNPTDIIFTEAMISNYMWLNVEIELYLKFKYCSNTLKAKAKR